LEDFPCELSSEASAKSAKKKQEERRPKKMTVPFQQILEK
jgi:hypothetical protein